MLPKALLRPPFLAMTIYLTYPTSCEALEVPQKAFESPITATFVYPVSDRDPPLLRIYNKVAFRRLEYAHPYFKR
jgi:hypothetical protein